MFLKNLLKPRLPQTGLLFYPYYDLLVFLVFFMLYVMREHDPNPPRGTGLTAPCRYSRLLYLQTGWLLKIVLKSLNYATRRSSGPPCATYWSVAEEL